MKDGSYHVSSFSANTQAEIRRLDAQVDLFWRWEKEILLRSGLRDGIDYLDCGCGPGRLLELVKGHFPAVRFTGLEMDPILVEAAKFKFHNRGFSDCRVVQGTAESPNLPEGSYDFITMRLVLEHVPDPVLALKSLGRLLRPGGRLVVISNDFENHTRTWPPVQELEQLYVAYRASRRKDGGDPCIARRVPALLKTAGFTLIGQEVEAAHNAIIGDEPFLKAEGVGIPAQLVSSGFLEQSVFESMIKSWKAMLAHPDHCIVRQLYLATGERRAENASTTALATGAAQPTETKATTAEPAEFQAPGSDLEEKLSQLWCEAMKVNRVSVRGNFFDLGGDSLMLEQVHSQLKEKLGYDLQITFLFQYPTIETLAEYLEKSVKSAPHSAAAAASVADDGIAGEPATPAPSDLELQAQRRREAMNRRKKPGAN